MVNLIKRACALALATTGWVLLFATAAQAQFAPGPPPPGPEALFPDARPLRSCESLTDVSLPNTTIESAVADGTVCRVTAVTTHPPVGDRVTIWIGIPLEGWNGRFMGNGGGGFSGGSANGIDQPVQQGYAAGSTDTGHEGASGSFALAEDGSLAWQLIRDNAHVGIHEMTVTGKALTEALYGRAPQYSYWNGCSTGGRQGLMEAQRYPDDYDGIMAGAPAINWPKLHVQQLWGPVLMQNESNPVAPCKLAAISAAALAACDTIDGVEDGVIEDPSRCEYDAAEFVGSATDCGTFTAVDASIINHIWTGPSSVDGTPLWIGAPKSSDLSALSNSRGVPLQPQAMGITLDWFRYFLTQDTNFDWTTITHAGFERLWEQSVEQFGTVIGTDDPDLSAFRDRGGKAIVWHGWTDQLISAYGSINYYERVIDEMGGLRTTQNFIRLFMAPGVNHCAGGTGPNPTGQMEALIDWVENGKAPDTLRAEFRQGSDIVRSRPLCPYPQVARYRNRGSSDDAENFVCSDDF
jgi:feruloyl esterase